MQRKMFQSSKDVTRQEPKVTDVKERMNCKSQMKLGRPCHERKMTSSLSCDVDRMYIEAKDALQLDGLMILSEYAITDDDDHMVAQISPL